jgi:hypothetical protein
LRTENAFVAAGPVPLIQPLHQHNKKAQPVHQKTRFDPEVTVNAALVDAIPDPPIEKNTSAATLPA